MKDQTVFIFDVKMTQYAEGKEICREIAVSAMETLCHLSEAILGSFEFVCDHCFGFYGDIHKHPGREQSEAYELFADVGKETTVSIAQGVEETQNRSPWKCRILCVNL